MTAALNAIATLAPWVLLGVSLLVLGVTVLIETVRARRSPRRRG